MAPKSRKVRGPSRTVAISAEYGGAIKYPPFPQLTEKQGLQCTVLEEDQVFLVDDLFSPEECKAFITFIEQLPLQATPPKKKGEADRLNYRLSIQSREFAECLFKVLKPHLPVLPVPAADIRKLSASIEAHSLNSNIRLYRYAEGQHFGKHYDDSVKDSLTGAQSEWTILIYLTGEAQGVVGGQVLRQLLLESFDIFGQTVFYREKKGQPAEEIIAPLTQGTALLHRHGHECMLHEGRKVLQGVKYVLRSDLMFKR